MNGGLNQRNLRFYDSRDILDKDQIYNHNGTTRLKVESRVVLGTKAYHAYYTHI